MTAVAINLILFAVLLYGVFRLQGQNLSLSVRVLIALVLGTLFGLDLRLARGPLPTPVVERIRRWGGYYGAAAIETLTLVEMRDLQALAELRQDAVLRDLLTPFPAGDRALAVVPTERIAALEARLAELGVVVRRGLAGQ